MLFLTEEQVRSIGFISVGSNLKISDKASFHDPYKIEIGDDSRIDGFCIISGKSALVALFILRCFVTLLVV